MFEDIRKFLPNLRMFRNRYRICQMIEERSLENGESWECT